MGISAIRNPKAAAARLGLSVKGQAYLLAGILAVFYGVELIDLALRTFTDYSLDPLGIRPRNLWGLLGIPLSPFLHGGFVHLMANTLPFFILGWLVLLSGRETFFKASAIITFAGGLGVWIFGSTGTVHIGASGLIYGYLGFIVVRAYLEKKLTWILIAIAAGFLYSGLIFSLFNVFKEDVSWSGHFFGLGAGALAAYLLNGRKAQTLPGSPSSKSPAQSPKKQDEEVDVQALLEEFRKNHPDA